MHAFQYTQTHIVTDMFSYKHLMSILQWMQVALYF